MSYDDDVRMRRNKESERTAIDRSASTFNIMFQRLSASSKNIRFITQISQIYIKRVDTLSSLLQMLYIYRGENRPRPRDRTAREKRNGEKCIPRLRPVHAKNWFRAK